MIRPARALAALLLAGSALALPARARAGAAEADAAAAAGREAAGRNRNGEAAAHFRKAIAEDPSRRVQWQGELADQTTYAGDAGQAIPMYRELLAPGGLPPADARRAHIGLALALSWDDQLDESLAEYDALLARNPDDLDARLGRARVLSWQGKLGPAKREYERVLARDPDNVEARRGLARVQSWRGKQRDAQRRLTEFLRDHPGDAEGAFLLAQAQDWMGRPDRAKATLGDALTRNPEDTPAKTLREDLAFRERPDTRVDFLESHQSDQLTIRSFGVEQNFRLNDGRTTVGPRYQFYRYDPARPDRDIDVNRYGVYARHRFTDAVEWTGNLFADVVHQHEGGQDDHTILTYDTFVTLWPSDSFRFDVGSSRTTFDNIKSLSRNVTATYANLSADFTPDEKTRFTGRFNWGDYTDGNERRWGQFEAERRLWNHPKFYAGWRYTGFDFTQELDNGYYNPNTYQSNELTLRTAGDLRGKLYYSFAGSYGVEHANPGGDQAIWSASARLIYRIVDRLELEGRYAFSSSATASSGGFERGTAGAALRFVW